MPGLIHILEYCEISQHMQYLYTILNINIAAV